MASLHAILFAMSVAALTPASAQSQAASEPGSEPGSVLVFSKTAGFRHESIGPGIDAIKRLGTQQGFLVTATEDASVFNTNDLKRYAAVIFLSTTGDVLDRDQERAFEEYVRSGHGFVGIHAAADTEFEWPWYGRLVGGYFESHDVIQDATVIVARPFGSAPIPQPWVRRDEWYNYKQFDRDVNVILKLDTMSFKGSKHPGNHPIAWYREFDGGRSFYTGLGHTTESYSEPAFLEHLLDGIRYAMGSPNSR
jgi:type 1 glutamine amidotransferase